MENPALDQLIGALFATVVPILVACAIVGTLLGVAFKWLQRKAVDLGRAPLETTAKTLQTVSSAPAGVVPYCPNCSSLMVQRTARRGTNAGSKFWGCSSYPRCKGTRPV